MAVAKKAVKKAVKAKEVEAKPKAEKVVKPPVAKAMDGKKVAPKKEVEKKAAEVVVEAPVVAEAPKEIEGLPTLKELLEAGAHFGHVVRRWNPKMSKYIYTAKNGIHIIDLFKTRANLITACTYLEESTKKGAKVMLVGTKGQASELMRTEAVRLGIPYITTRWVGGLFTNWEQIKNRVNKLIDMKKKHEAGEYKKYTKKEQVDLKKTIDRLERMYGGLVSLDSLPDIIFVVDPSREVTAIAESIARNIQIVAIADTNCDPTGIAHVIPANDDAIKSVTILVNTVIAAIERGLKASKISVK
jgi:small subunit ribosomal protein S2